jgi:hypothetical protein
VKIQLPLRGDNASNGKQEYVIMQYIKVGSNNSMKNTIAQILHLSQLANYMDEYRTKLTSYLRE